MSAGQDVSVLWPTLGSNGPRGPWRGRDPLGMSLVAPWARWGVSGETHVFQLSADPGSQETSMLKWKPLANASVIAALIAVYSVLAAPHKW